jgi:ubiquinone/menaquinone biosynthesis C-methylase UbiE
LLDADYSVTALDISPEALDRAKRRLGERGKRIRWIMADVTQVHDLGVFDVWHDRATFHFLTLAADREKYAQLLKRSVRIGGHAIIATFAPGGPAQCSGLRVMRYDGQSLLRELSLGFELLKSVMETHQTPRGGTQLFQFSLFCRRE